MPRQGLAGGAGGQRDYEVGERMIFTRPVGDYNNQQRNTGA